MEELFSRLAARGRPRPPDELEIRQRNAADRARAAGRLRPRRGERDRPRSTGRPPAIVEHHRRRARERTRRAASASDDADGRRWDARRAASPGTAEPEAARADPVAWVEVAVDAAGAGGDRAVHVPPCRRLGGRRGPGEAVLVDFGRRRALGVVLASAATPPERRDEARPRPGPRRRPAPAAALARAGRVDRGALPRAAGRVGPGDAPAADSSSASSSWPSGVPGAERPRRPTGRSRRDARRLLEQLADWPAPGPTTCAATGAAAGLLRRLRELEARGAITLEWELRTAAGAGPRFERWLRLTADAGVDGASRSRPSERPAGRPLGPAPAAPLWRELADAGRADERVGRTTRGAPRQRRRRPALARRGLAAPRSGSVAGGRSTDGRSGGVAGGRPAPTCRPSRRRPSPGDRRGDRGPRPAPRSCSTGSPAAGKTAVYVEAIAARRSTPAGPPSSWCRRSRSPMPLVDRLRADLDVEVAAPPLGARRRRARGRVAPHPGRRGRRRRRHADRRHGAAARTSGVIIVDEEHDAAYKSDRTPRLQARDVAVRLGALAGAAVVLGQRHAGRRDVGRARAGTYRARHAAGSALAGAPPAVEVVDLRAELAAGNRGLLSAPLVAALAALDRRARASGRSWSSTGAGAASVVLCRDCGHVQACPDCERPLVYHEAASRLRCHHCGATAAVPRRCPACARPGSGTSAAARSASSARSASASRAPGGAPRPRRRRAQGRGRARSSTRSPRAGWTSSSGTSLVDQGPRRPRGHARRRRVARTSP